MSGCPKHHREHEKEIRGRKIGARNSSSVSRVVKESCHSFADSERRLISRLHSSAIGGREPPHRGEKKNDRERILSVGSRKDKEGTGLTKKARPAGEAPALGAKRLRDIYIYRPGNKRRNRRRRASIESLGLCGQST